MASSVPLKKKEKKPILVGHTASLKSGLLSTGRVGSLRTVLIEQLSPPQIFLFFFSPEKQEKQGKKEKKTNFGNVTEGQKFWNAYEYIAF